MNGEIETKLETPTSTRPWSRARVYESWKLEVLSHILVTALFLLTTSARPLGRWSAEDCWKSDDEKETERRKQRKEDCSSALEASVFFHLILVSSSRSWCSLARRKKRLINSVLALESQRANPRTRLIFSLLGSISDLFIQKSFPGSWCPPNSRQRPRGSVC